MENVKTLCELAECGKIHFAFALRIAALSVGNESVRIKDAPAGGRYEYDAIAGAGIARIEGDRLAFNLTPDSLPHGAAFASTWAKWCAYRKERKKQMTAMTRTAQLTALAALSETEAIETIEESIKNGWTGLFPARIKHEQTKRGTDKHRRPDGTRAGEFPHEGRKANEF